MIEVLFTLSHLEKSNKISQSTIEIVEAADLEIVDLNKLKAHSKSPYSSVAFGI